MKRLFLSFCYLPDTMMFKLEELHAVCRTLGTTVNVVGEAEGTGGVFITADFENLEIARRVCRRLTLLKGAFELWGKGGDDGFAEMKESIMAGTYVSPDERAKYKDVTFKFVFDAIGCKISWTEKVARFNRLSDIGLDGKIEMDNPSEVFYIIEDRGLPTSNKKDLPPLARVYFARLIEQGARREFDTYSLKTRKYIGTTTMIPELCMLMANVACVTKNSLVWDPFCGTGSTLVSSAHYGAQCFGSDLDGRALGTQENGIQSNCKQYGFQPFELMRTDLSKVPFRSGLTEFLDAIISDPPYGRREPRKKIDETRQNQLEEFITSMTDDQQQARLDRIHTTDYIPPPKMEYALPQLLTDLVSTAAKVCTAPQSGGWAKAHLRHKTNPHSYTRSSLERLLSHRLAAACRRALGVLAPHDKELRPLGAAKAPRDAACVGSRAERVDQAQAPPRCDGEDTRVGGGGCDGCANDPGGGVGLPLQERGAQQRAVPRVQGEACREARGEHQVPAGQRHRAGAEAYEVRAAEVPDGPDPGQEDPQGSEPCRERHHQQGDDTHGADRAREDLRRRCVGPREPAREPIGEEAPAGRRSRQLSRAVLPKREGPCAALMSRVGDISSDPNAHARSPVSLSSPPRRPHAAGPAAATPITPCHSCGP